ncbi:hypothetical protein F8388_003118 [Cannabis sativa]|uniref:EGF-like domain-containing protein n=1 Tax=Cannabis sativa TaxID=3483 RepID=A0A7J6EAR8_CANSA|nr:hypothetical protein F8388_003118 [Cannabis sativa]
MVVWPGGGRRMDGWLCDNEQREMVGDAAERELGFLLSSSSTESPQPHALASFDIGKSQQRLRLCYRLTLDNDGNLRIYGFDPDQREWTEVLHATHKLCTIHDTCGANAICTSNGFYSSSCVCPPGFAGDNPKEKGEFERSNESERLRIELYEKSNRKRHVQRRPHHRSQVAESIRRCGRCRDLRERRPLLIDDE